MTKTSHKIKGMIPNFITCLNLLCGCIGSVFAFNGELTIAFWMVIIAAVFDFFDGFVARLLKAYSPMGKELDSLADLISFGMVPAAVFFALGLGYPAFLIVIFSALRLAKFNIDTRQTSEFIGLATPANALFFTSLGYIYAAYDEGTFLSSYLENRWILLGLVVLFSLLMTSEIRMFSLKMKDYQINKNKIRYGFLICSLISLVLFKIIAVPFIILTYIIINIINHLCTSRQTD